MSSKFSLEAILSLTDQLTGPYKQTTNKITALNKGLTGSFGTLNNGINKTIGFAGKGLLRASQIGLGAIAVGTGLAVREFIALDESITQAGAKFKDLDSTSSTYAETLERLSKTAQEARKGSEFSSSDAAGALDKMAMAGLDSEQAMALLKGTVDLGTAAGTDLTTAVDIATDSLGAFNLMTEDTVQLQENLNRVSDVMAKTTTTANTSLTEMFEAVGAGASVFTSAGQQMETFAAFTGVLANSTLKGGAAGTSLRNVMLRLANPTGEAAKALSDLGVVTADSQGNFRDVIDILGDFEKGLDGMGNQQRTAALSTIFGAKTVTGINLLLAEGSDKLRTYREDLINSAGASRTMADAMRNSFGKKLAVLKEDVSGLGVVFIKAFEGQGTKALNKLIEIVQNFDMQKVIDAVNKAVETFRNMVNFIIDNKGAIEGLAIALASFKIAVIAVNTVLLIQKGLMLAGPVLAMIKVFMALAKTEGILATAQYALNVAMTANPVGVIIMGVAALVAGFILLVKHTGSVTEALKLMGKGITTSLLMPVNLVLEAVKGLLTVLSKIPGVGKFITPAIDALSKLQDTMNTVTLYNEGKNALLGGGGDSSEQSQGYSTQGQQPMTASMQAIQKDKSSQDIETKQRYDLYLNAPAGYAMYGAGEEPSTAVNLGAKQ